eukprot:Hpha_TRINITY_DN6725_c0_g1::TRINITY_DN6725_c0_g1_i1::g.110932::m.110932
MEKRVVLNSAAWLTVGLLAGSFLSSAPHQGQCPPCPACSETAPQRSGHTALVSDPPTRAEGCEVGSKGADVKGNVETLRWGGLGRVSWRAFKARLGGLLFQVDKVEPPGFDAEDARVLLLHHSPNTSEGFGQCSEFDVVYTTRRPGLCIALVETSLRERAPQFVDRLRLIEEWPKAHGVQAGGRSSGLIHFNRISEGFPTFRQHQAGLAMSSRFMQRFAEMESHWSSVLAASVNPCRGCPGHGLVISMATNAGNIHFVLNWLCSARKAGLRPKVVVFASDRETRDRMGAVEGVTVLWDPAFGDIPKEAATKYGDSIFGRVMWLKTLAVFLPVQMGYTTLFQDTDLVWFADPIPRIAELMRDGADAVWQDDGARAHRFSPFFANSGFFVVAGNAKGQHFALDLFLGQGYVYAWQSQQALVNILLQDARVRYGMDVRLLDGEEFPTGMHFNHRPHLMTAWLGGTRALPTAFHMCWTSDGKLKERELKGVGWWFIKDE